MGKVASSTLLRTFKLSNNNITKNKSIYELRNQFKDNYKYSEQEIDLIEDIDFMKHFYSPDEIHYYKNKYT